MLVGVVGKPNCGKSTFFKAATLAEVEIANYPFVTINPNEGVGFVKVDCADKDFNVKCQPRHGYCMDNQRFVPVKLLDVAGLVPGAYKGLGRGNEFLDDLNQADALIHVIDVSGSTNEKGEPVDALSYDPAEDIKFLEIELDMWYLKNIAKGWDRFARQVQQESLEIHKALGKQLSFLRVTENMIEDAIKKLDLNKQMPTEWTKDELKQMASMLRQITKPVIIAANKIDVPGAERNLERLQKDFPAYIIIACSAESELALREAAKHELIDYIPGDGNFTVKDDSKLNERQRNGLNFIKADVLQKFKTTGVQQVLNDAVFKLLKNIAVYPVANSKLQDKDGNVMPDCFLVPDGITALEFAFKIHTDIGKNFIKAMDLKTKQVIGKEHKLKNGDVIEIMVKK